MSFFIVPFVEIAIPFASALNRTVRVVTAKADSLLAYIDRRALVVTKVFVSSRTNSLKLMEISKNHGSGGWLSDLRRKLNLMSEMLVSPRAVELVLVRFSHALPLIFNVLLYDLFTDLARRGHKVAPRPERGQTEQTLVLLTQHVRASALKGVDDLIRCVSSIGLHEEMHVIQGFTTPSRILNILNTSPYQDTSRRVRIGEMSAP